MILIIGTLAVVALAITRRYFLAFETAMVAAIVMLLIWPTVTPRHDYSDPFGGHSACAPVVSDGYDATFIIPWSHDVKYQAGTICWGVTDD